jgi:hypothetical protein
VLVTGVGGTGVVTIGAVMAQAAQIDGKGVGMIEMAGLAQKGGAVWIHLRLAERPEDISAIRVGLGEAHAVIGGDLVVTGGAKTLGLMRARAVTGAAVNATRSSPASSPATPNSAFPARICRSRLRRGFRTGCAVRCDGTCAHPVGGFDLFQHDGLWRGLADGVDPAEP